MKHEYIENIYDLMEYVKKTNMFNMTSREFREFEIEISEAVEKQVPRKPREWNDECWGCGEQLSAFYDHPNHCPNCGQKVDWS